MAKRVDHDSTMEVSSSQLDPDAKKRPAPHRAPGVDKNDVSMWIGGVVGADEFSQKAKRKPQQIRWSAVIIALLLLVGLLGGAVYLLFIRKSSPSAAPKVAPHNDAAVVAPLVLDAEAAPAVAGDAGVDAAAGGDAGAGDAALPVDAITGAGGDKPPVKKTTTKKKVVKKVTKKKPAPKKK
jgi:hypothetical protein